MYIHIRANMQVYGSAIDCNKFLKEPPNSFFLGILLRAPPWPPTKRRGKGTLQSQAKNRIAAGIPSLEAGGVRGLIQIPSYS